MPIRAHARLAAPAAASRRAPDRAFFPALRCRSSPGARLPLFRMARCGPCRRSSRACWRLAVACQEHLGRQHDVFGGDTTCKIVTTLCSAPKLSQWLHHANELNIEHQKMVQAAQIMLKSIQKCTGKMKYPPVIMDSIFTLDELIRTDKDFWPAENKESFRSLVLSFHDCEEACAIHSGAPDPRVNR